MSQKLFITITGASVAPSWVSLQELVRTTLGHAEDGKITRISRRDGGCNYRASGVYDATYITALGDQIDITLTISEGN